MGDIIITNTWAWAKDAPKNPKEILPPLGAAAISAWNATPWRMLIDRGPISLLLTWTLCQLKFCGMASRYCDTKRIAVLCTNFLLKSKTFTPCLLKTPFAPCSFSKYTKALL